MHDAVEETRSGINPGKLERSRHIRVATYNNIFYVYNSKKGNVSAFDMDSDTFITLNILNGSELYDYKGFSFDGCFYYFLSDTGIEVYNTDFKFQMKFELPFEADDFCFEGGKFYFVKSKESVVSIYHDLNLPALSEFSIKGMGSRAISIVDGKVWLTDEDENLVYVYFLESGCFDFSMITPYVAPQGAVCLKGENIILYAGLTTVVTYDDVSFQQQKPFLHKLVYKRFENPAPYILTNSFVVELTYEEHIDLSADYDKYENLELYLALPTENERQQVIGIKPVGLNFDIIKKNDISYAHYKLGKIDKLSSGVVGYKALLKLSSIKYQLDSLKYDEVDTLPLEIAREIDDYENIGTELEYIKGFSNIDNSENMLNDVLALRNKVYASLYYRPNNYAADIAEVLKDGYATCGDYSSILLALLKLNNIPVRSLGGFKVTRFNNSQQELVTNYYNHTWVEFYSSKYGWLPMESSSDGKEIDGKYCEGQFLGEDWTHIRTHNNKSTPHFIRCFDKGKEVDPYSIFRNMIFEKILGEEEL